MATERASRTTAGTPRVLAWRPRRRVGTVVRYRRWVRWLHVGVYVTVLILLATGGWLLLGREGDPSPLSRLAGIPDTQLHVWVGWAFTAVLVGGVVIGVRGAVTFVRESVRYDRGDGGWLRAWPRAIFNGHFPTHRGHFDPGQRLANLAMVAGFVTVTASGIAMALLHGGPAFVWLVPLHRWSTYLLIPLLAGHILIASGILPGYRGAWRSMHLGGRLDVSVARRLWPGWLDRHERDEV
jgi:cytochrome b subunit of formate dehydrogenase